MSRTSPNGHTYHLTTVNMADGTTDHPDMSFPTLLLLQSHVNAAYPKHSSYLIVAVAAPQHATAFTLS